MPFELPSMASGGLDGVPSLSAIGPHRTSHNRHDEETEGSTNAPVMCSQLPPRLNSSADGVHHQVKKYPETEATPTLTHTKIPTDSLGGQTIASRELQDYYQADRKNIEDGMESSSMALAKPPTSPSASTGLSASNNLYNFMNSATSRPSEANNSNHSDRSKNLQHPRAESSLSLQSGIISIVGVASAGLTSTVTQSSLQGDLSLNSAQHPSRQLTGVNSFRSCVVSEESPTATDNTATATSGGRHSISSQSIHTEQDERASRRRGDHQANDSLYTVLGERTTATTATDGATDLQSGFSLGAAMPTVEHKSSKDRSSKRRPKVFSTTTTPPLHFADEPRQTNNHQHLPPTAVANNNSNATKAADQSTLSPSLYPTDTCTLSYNGNLSTNNDSHDRQFLQRSANNSTSQKQTPQQPISPSSTTIKYSNKRHSMETEHVEGSAAFGGHLPRNRVSDDRVTSITLLDSTDLGQHRIDGDIHNLHEPNSTCSNSQVSESHTVNKEAWNILPQAQFNDKQISMTEAEAVQDESSQGSNGGRSNGLGRELRRMDREQTVPETSRASRNTYYGPVADSHGAQSKMKVAAVGISEAKIVSPKASYHPLVGATRHKPSNRRAKDKGESLSSAFLPPPPQIGDGENDHPNTTEDECDEVAELSMSSAGAAAEESPVSSGCVPSSNENFNMGPSEQGSNGSDPFSDRESAPPSSAPASGETQPRSAGSGNAAWSVDSAKVTFKRKGHRAKAGAAQIAPINTNDFFWNQIEEFEATGEKASRSQSASSLPDESLKKTSTENNNNNNSNPQHSCSVETAAPPPLSAPLLLSPTQQTAAVSESVFAPALGPARISSPPTASVGQITASTSNANISEVVKASVPTITSAGICVVREPEEGVDAAPSAQAEDHHRVKVQEAAKADSIQDKAEGFILTNDDAHDDVELIEFKQRLPSGIDVFDFGRTPPASISPVLSSEAYQRMKQEVIKTMSRQEEVFYSRDRIRSAPELVFCLSRALIGLTTVVLICLGVSGPLFIVTDDGAYVSTMESGQTALQYMRNNHLSFWKETAEVSQSSAEPGVWTVIRNTGDIPCSTLRKKLSMSMTFGFISLIFGLLVLVSLLTQRVCPTKHWMFWQKVEGIAGLVSIAFLAATWGMLMVYYLGPNDEWCSNDEELYKYRGIKMGYSLISLLAAFCTQLMGFIVFASVTTLCCKARWLEFSVQARLGGTQQQLPGTPTGSVSGYSGVSARSRVPLKASQSFVNRFPRKSATELTLVSQTEGHAKPEGEALVTTARIGLRRIGANGVRPASSIGSSTAAVTMPADGKADPPGVSATNMDQAQVYAPTSPHSGPATPHSSAGTAVPD